KKIDDLKTAIDQISNKILCKKIRQDFVDGEWKDVCDESGEDTTGDKLLNRVGFVPFNLRTREIVSGNKAHVTSQLSYRNDYNISQSTYTYNDIVWDDWRSDNIENIFYCASSPAYCEPVRNWGWNNERRSCESNSSQCPEISLKNQEYAKRIVDILQFSSYPDVYNYVDFPSSVSTMFFDKSAFKSNYYTASEVKLFLGFGEQDSRQFRNVFLTNKLSDLDSIKSMWADGGTAAFQGILRGVQILQNGEPNSKDEDEQQTYNEKIKMLLILSDGQESPNNGILKGLVDAGMCDKARAEIPGLYIGVIGIDFRASQQSGLQDCVI
ncbi:pilus assembly protein TadG, partial [Vibrio harveyi]